MVWYNITNKPVTFSPRLSVYSVMSESASIIIGNRDKDRSALYLDGMKHHYSTVTRVLYQMNIRIYVYYLRRNRLDSV